MKDILLLAHFIGLIVGAGSAFAVLAIGYLARNFDSGYRQEALIKLFPLRYISYLGLGLLIISGMLMTPSYWPAPSMLPGLMILKLIFVTIILALSAWGMFLMRRIRQGAGVAGFKRLGVVGKLSFASSLAVVTCAVYLFH